MYLNFKYVFFTEIEKVLTIESFHYFLVIMSRIANQPKQKVVYVRVTKMFLPRSNPNVARNIFQQIQPGYSGVISPLMPTRMIDMYSSSAILAFRFCDPEKSNVTFIVTELTQARENEVCRLCLPISWFPHGYVVHHYFPFITKTPQNGTPFIELDVHVADIQTPPFSAYYGTLKVIPTWTPPPQMTAGATIIISSPIQFQQPAVPQNQQQQHKNQQPATVVNQPINKTKEQNQKENDKLTIMKNKHTHHEYTPLVETFSDDSEIMLDDLDDVLTDESKNQNPPPVINPSKSNDNQNNLQHPQQVQQPSQNAQQHQIQQQSQSQPQQFQQLPQSQHQPQYSQPPPQYAQQPPPQYAQQPQYTQHQNSKSHKVQYPPFPPLPGQNQPSQPPQQLEHKINNGDPN